MQDAQGLVVVLVSALQQAIGQVDVFAVHEKVLVQQAGLVERRPPHHAKGARDHVDGISFAAVQITHVVSSKASGFGKSAHKPLILQKEVKGVGRPRRDSQAKSPSSFSIATPVAPAPGWASMKARQPANTSSPTMVSGLSNNTYSPSERAMAMLLAREKPLFSVFLSNALRGNAGQCSPPSRPTTHCRPPRPPPRCRGRPCGRKPGTAPDRT